MEAWFAQEWREDSGVDLDKVGVRLPSSNPSRRIRWAWYVISGSNGRSGKILGLEVGGYQTPFNLCEPDSPHLYKKRMTPLTSHRF